MKQFWIGTPKVCVGTMIIPWMGFILSQVHKGFSEIGHSFYKPLWRCIPIVEGKIGDNTDIHEVMMPRNDDDDGDNIHKLS